MLKDYYNPNLSPKYQSRIAESLSSFPSWTVFGSYAQARSYRASHDYKEENGRYRLSIVLYDGFYYLMTKEQLYRFKLLLHSFSLNNSMDYHISAFNNLFNLEK
ncbi:MAG: hypothetical protein U0K79_08455 [Phascolarctobacterium sp.]|nr:hypothetical protein [Phascolarctobacterium sp.]